ncbi:MAG: S8 family serine peptidase [Phycisphaerae bacterium]|nr:S8 family serine peptidase [Phycisphaerae bacterium]
MTCRLLNFVVVLLFCTTLAVAAGEQPGALDVAGVYKVRSIDPNLTGIGVDIGLVCRSDTYVGSKPQNDYRPDISHNSFNDIKIRFYDSGTGDTGVSGHSTAIASILAGLDPNAYLSPLGNFSYEGACPYAGLDVYEFRHFLEEFVFPGGWPQVDLLTMSFGWASEDWWTRGIDRMAEQFGFLVIAAIGNGKDSYDLPLYPAAGSNVLAVGVADSTDSLSSFGVPDVNHSTAGPTLDGRCKPDIVAPGNCLVAVAGTKNSYRPSGDYSSFAAPVVTGVASLLIQKARSEPSLQFAVSPFTSNCVLKSILMTSAKKLAGWHKGFPQSDDDYEYPLDFSQGAGMVDGFAAYSVLTAGMQQDGIVASSGWDTTSIEPNYIAEKAYRFKADGFKNPYVSLTLVWNRVYEDEYPFAPVWQSWADLQLELWVVDANGRGQLVDYSNSSVDNVEHIYTALDPNSEYEFVISNSLVSDLPDRFTPYAVSWMVVDNETK